MPLLINLVATRCLDGDHAMMFRWYNDHVHLLMDCEALQEATLFRRVSAPRDGAAEYLCLYTFGSGAAFQQFETSTARARAQAVVRAGWASTGLSILQRTQYRRIGHNPQATERADFRFAELAMGAAAVPESDRWLNDRVHAAWGDAPGQRAWLRAGGAADAGDALVFGQGADTGVLATAIDAWAAEAVDPAFGRRPDGLTVRWQADFRRLRHWTR